MPIAPVEKFEFSGDPQAILHGEKLLKEGKMGTIVLAGGQGTRLDFPHPKGMFPVSPVKQKSLFQLIAEKTVAASHAAGRPLLLAFMTSPENDRETKDYFIQNNNFGLSHEQLFFFSQGELPLQDEQERILPLMASDGNGSVFEHFVKTGLWDIWQKRGVEFINIVLVDNPLADPFDKNLLGVHAKNGLDVTIKCCQRRAPDEKVGLLVRQDHRLVVIEYSEIEAEAAADLNYSLANISLFCLSMPFIKLLADQIFPLHRAKKPVKNQSIMGYKFEKFIFDLLLFTTQASMLVYPREVCFAPLKNKTGDDSPETVKKALESYDLKLIEQITQKKQAVHPFELSAPFHYPTPKLLAQWKGVTLRADQHYLT